MYITRVYTCKFKKPEKNHFIKSLYEEKRRKIDVSIAVIGVYKV